MRASIPRSMLLLAPALAGCGFGLQQFGPDTGIGDDDDLLTYVPDTGETSEDGGSTGDAGSTGDGGTTGDAGSTGDGGTTGDGGGGGGGGSAPELSNLNVSEGPDRIEVSFIASDADDDLDGGILRLVVDGSTQNLTIPGDISDWRPSGTSTHYLDLDPCDAGSNISVEATLIDAAGHSSSTRNDSVVLSGESYTLSETGNDALSITNIGEISRGTVICGNMYAASNDGSAYTGDIDFVQFSPTSTGNLTFVLTWEASGGDYNLSLFDTGFTTWLGDASTVGTAQPEYFTYNASAAQNFVLRIAGASGSAGDYMVMVE